jgi:hypothetical protein
MTVPSLKGNNEPASPATSTLSLAFNGRIHQASARSPGLRSQRLMQRSDLEGAFIVDCLERALEYAANIQSVLDAQEEPDASS